MELMESDRLPDLKLFIIIKTVMVLAQNPRNIDQWNRIKSLAINLHTYGLTG